MAITDWPEQERPREKLLRAGAARLSDAELLAIFLRVGIAGKTAVDLARDLMRQFKSLNGVFAADLQEMTAVPGMGVSKYCQLQAVLEMSKRALGETLQQSDSFRSPNQVKDYLQLQLSQRQREVFGIMFLDAQNRLIAFETLFEGSLMQTSVYPREVVKRALDLNAAALILSHNHPGGNALPSAADEQLTQCLKEALNLVDIRVLDHIIVAKQETFSFSEQGLI
ncbi:RadC family protein [Methylophilus medardicus]|uniref:JAB domain-containing protein n=1 Tax=Methylophilus medardicus TaxID=2588534 RepID=A0A5B8CQ47_9PROT|nr:DNA repair protein RadC [Methylophilus medardicus]QDC43395.1 JAB domain-containing protein [Methylophilus medardicus]QDC48402.1 JAB domain-containing protein [Methylophilus medardicus]QDC52107.1 JAB domain-containing protein [Methylophilus medardicus]